MTGKILTPKVHRCFFGVPPEAGWFSPIGTRWQCDDCGSVWALVKNKGWVKE